MNADSEYQDMVKVTIDKSLRQQLDSLHEEAQLCDESGQTVGYYVPQSVRLKKLYEWAKAEVSDEELERAYAEPGGSSLAEIWKRLGVR